MFQPKQIAETAGLYTKTAAVPLQEVSISAEVLDVASKVTVRQRFKNTEATPIEATYCFPLEEGSAVCGFEVKIGDRLIQGRVEEREKAFEKYDEAMAGGHGAFLLDQEKPNIFIASVGNLMPAQEALVSITYVAELPIHDDQIRLMIPTTLSPRYAPADADPVKVDLISPPVTLDAPYRLSLEVSLKGASQIDKAFSPSHQITIQQGEDVWNVSLAAAEKLDRDFILEIKHKEPKAPFARVQTHENGDRAVMLRLYPEFDPDGERSPTEVIFVLDCSGSMQGSSIEQAKRALELCLRTLSTDDSFNVIRFGSGFEKLFQNSREYNDDSLEQAIAYLRRIGADLGGTELYPALSHILNEMPLWNGIRRDLIVLTDGEVVNEEEIISLGRRHRKKARIFSFGIGYGASESLVRGLARATGGATEFISPDERIEEKVLRQFSRLGTPAMTDVRINWKGLRVKQSPVELPPIFSGDSFTIYGLVENGNVDGELSLSAKMEGKDVVWSAPVCFSGSGNLIPTLWARNYIRDLEDGAGLEGSSRQISRKAEGVKKILVEIGTRYQLVSSETSFVAVETSSDSERATEQAEYRRVPIQLTKDWHGTLSLRNAVLAHLGPNQLAAPRAYRLSSLITSRELLSLDTGAASTQESKAGPDWVYDLLRGQTAPGWFRWTDELPTLLGKSVQELTALIRRVEGVRGKMRKHALSTALTLIILETKAAEFKSQWSRAAEKAKKWLSATGASLNGKPVLDALKELLSPEPLKESRA